jgi:hypothetical protein
MLVGFLLACALDIKVCLSVRELTAIISMDQLGRWAEDL